MGVLFSSPYSVCIYSSQLSDELRDYVFVVSEEQDHGIQAYDLNRLASHPLGEDVFPDATFTGIGKCHNIIANPNQPYVYGCGCKVCES